MSDDENGGGLLDGLKNQALDALAAVTPDMVGMILCDTGIALDFAGRVHDAHAERPADEGAGDEQ